jgi:hypothetical protein
MAATLQFFDMSVSMTPPTGHQEPMPVTLGPNWQPGDIRLFFISAASTPASGAETEQDIPMDPDPPTGYTASFDRTPGWDNHGTYFRRLVVGDNSTGVIWPKPAGWRLFMNAFLTIRGASPTATVTAGDLRITSNAGVATATAASVTVPSAGAMIFFAGNIASPEQTPWPNWGVAMGAPTGWTNLVASEKSGTDFYEYDTNPAVIVVAKTFASAGSTGTVTFPIARGKPAWAGMWAFVTAAADVSASIGAV